MAKHRKQFAPLSQNIFGIICVCVNVLVRRLFYLFSRGSFESGPWPFTKTIIHIRLNDNIHQMSFAHLFLPSSFSCVCVCVANFFFLFLLLLVRCFVPLFRLLCDVCTHFACSTNQRKHLNDLRVVNNVVLDG